jgi:hypothetical protein
MLYNMGKLSIRLLEKEMLWKERGKKHLVEKRMITTNLSGKS